MGSGAIQFGGNSPPVLNSKTPPGREPRRRSEFQVNPKLSLLGLLGLGLLRRGLDGGLFLGSHVATSQVD
jgi:hypothetical protein